MIKVFTTFTGVGSQEMALRNIGINYEVVGISEVDKNAIIAYHAIHSNINLTEYPSKEDMLGEFRKSNIAYNFSTNESEIPKKLEDIQKLYNAHKGSKNFGDIRLINAEELPDFDLFTYSFPCKNISVAGKQAGFVENSETQSSLLWECKKIIEARKPKYLLMENVKNITGKNHIDVLNTWIDYLGKIGYNSVYKVLNGKDFGIPQNRERCIMISIRKDLNRVFSFPNKDIYCPPLHSLLEEDVSSSYNLPLEKIKFFKGELPHQDISYCIDANYHKGTSLQGFLTKKRRQLVQVGVLDTKGSESNKRIYDSEGLCPTINSMNGGNRQPKVLNGTIIRRLTPLECWRVMGYSDEDFYKAKEVGLANTKLYERAGRGIIVPMLEEVFKELFKKELGNE